MKTTTKKTTRKIPLTTDEQALWDDIVRSLICRNEPAAMAAASADTIIAARRRNGP